MTLLRTAMANVTNHSALVGALLAAAITLVPVASNAQAYPTRPVKVIIPYGSGGIPDAAGRAIAERLTEHFGSPFFVENRAGAGGSMGVDSATAARPDGYTLLLGASGTLTISPSLDKSASSNLNELVPLSLIGSFDFVMLSAPALAGKSVKDIVQLAKANPDKLSVGSSGFGSEHHLLIELFKLTAGAPLTHVPYKGFGQGVLDVMGNRVELIFGSVPAAAPYVEGQKLGALAVTGNKRDERLANVPTFAELGYPEMAMTSWIGMLAPARTPQPALEKLATAMETILRSDQFGTRIAKLGLHPMTPGPDAFAKRMQADTNYWRSIISRANIEKNE
jgi:tripartite-type tricarboxylate transporter receptor subunit TctC